jgi:hypothetical protein
MKEPVIAIYDVEIAVVTFGKHQWSELYPMGTLQH